MSKHTPRIGVVGVVGGWSSEALADAVEKLTGFRLLIDMQRCVLDLESGRAMHGDVDLCELDGILIKKVGRSYSQDMLDRLEILRFVKSGGVPIFSDPTSILRLMDRLACTLTLARGGIPVPPTTVTESIDHALSAIAGYGQAVLKPLYSTKANGMQLVDASSEPDLRQRLTAFRDAGNPMLYIQKRLTIPERDLGVIFLGGEHVGTYARVKDSASWNTTTRDGGHYEPHAASSEIVALAWRAQRLFHLDLTSVDVVETEQGPVVFEVSAFGGFSGSQEALGIDLAARYARYAVERVAS
ncbi:MAG TPA: GAK system ATP-grasp enzyme [Polyangiaceae bacterium]|nr:GAK system ATP-grasp enzyme [Polyangiaceae bacterium]